jgi:YesN/AraC family two-component response regulator
VVKPAILIVDDEPRLLKNLSLLFKKDFHILVASDGREACMLFRSNPSLSLILLDIDMPVMNGTEALEIIRDISNDVKVIIMTGRSSHDYAKKCASLNVQGYVEKPFDVEQLRSQIKKQLGVIDFKVLKSLWADNYKNRLASISDLSKRTIHFLEKQYNARLNIRELAAYLKVSPEHLSRIFHKECGIRLKEYIRKLRIEKGKEHLLNNETLTIKEIAAFIGISCDKHFCRLFKNETGLTPGQYRKSKVRF